MMLYLLYFVTDLIIRLGSQAFLEIHKVGFLCASTTTKGRRNQIHNLLTSPKPWKTKLRKIIQSIRTSPSATASTTTWPPSEHFKNLNHIHTRREPLLQQTRTEDPLRHLDRSREHLHIYIDHRHHQSAHAAAPDLPHDLPQERHQSNALTAAHAHQLHPNASAVIVRIVTLTTSRTILTTTSLSTSTSTPTLKR